MGQIFGGKNKQKGDDTVNGVKLYSNGLLRFCLEAFETGPLKSGGSESEDSFWQKMKESFSTKNLLFEIKYYHF